MAIRVTADGTWGDLFYPIVVIGSSGGGSNRTYPAQDPANYFVFETTRQYTLRGLTFSYPNPQARVSVVSTDLAAGTGVANLNMYGVENRTMAYLIGQEITCDDGSTVTIDADAGTIFGQDFDFTFDPLDPAFPSYVTAIGGMEVA